MMFMLAQWYVSMLAILFAGICLFMIMVILIQKPRGGGLSGAFGGSGGNAQAAFGAKTGDVLTWFTVICFAAFLLLAVGLTWSIKPVDQGPVAIVDPNAPTDDVPTPGTNSENSPTNEPSHDAHDDHAHDVNHVTDDAAKTTP